MMWLNVILFITFTKTLPAMSGSAKTVIKEEPKISQFDQGFWFKFVIVDLVDGSKHTGQIVGVYNERPFMWHPKNRDTLTLFKCLSPELGLESFTAFPAATKNSIFTLNSDEISAIEIILPPYGSISYKEYLRKHDIIIKHQTIKDDEVFILEDWTTYHTWEDGRSNYAWDLSAINSELMTYSGQGHNLSDFAVFGLDLYLPLSGTVASVETNHPDNPPELIKALEFMTLDNGSEANLEEKPHNKLEITPGGPFLLRILHMQQDSIPETIKAGQVLENGMFIGKAGNSGTTFCPHVHLTFGFFDQNARYWSLPIEWKDYQRRVLIPFPTGTKFATFRNETYGYPKLNQLIKSTSV